MKTQILRIGGLGLLLAGVVAVTGSSNTPSGTVVASNSPPAKASNAVPDLLTYQPAPDVVQITNHTVLATNEDKVIASATLPADMQFSHNFTEVTKLVQAGVDESVVRSFISNTGGAFNIGSDEIVYLNDLGTSGDVIMAMMEHDQAWSGAAQSAPPPAATAPPPVVEPENNLTETAETAAVEYAQPTTVVVPQQPVTINYFCDTLSPYGTWVEIGGYGRCWQPTIVLRQPLWRPYCDNGRWIYTDCGWYWASDYSWGMTFHYGRWFRHARRGWCWAPDTVWAPAWVSWRSSSDYCGWAPLPPGTGWIPGVGFGYRNHAVGFGFDFGLTADCFTFVHYNRFRDRHVGRHAMPHREGGRVFNQTTVVNNFVHGNHNTVINQGITPGRVAAATGTQVTPVPVSQVAGNRHVAGPGHRGRLGFNRPTSLQFSQGGWPERPGNDNSRPPNANAGNRSVSTSPFTPVSPVTPNPDSSVQRQRPGNWMGRVHTPDQFRGRPDNTASSTRTLAQSAPTASTVSSDTTASSPRVVVSGQRGRPANSDSRPNADLSRFRSLPSRGEAIAGTAPVATPNPATAARQVERRPMGPSRQQIVVPQRDAASWPQTTITRPSVSGARVRPDASSRQVAVTERPQFQSPAVVARPQVLPQAPMVSAPQPSPRNPERSVRVTRDDSPGRPTVDHRQRNDQNWSGRHVGRR